MYQSVFYSFLCLESRIYFVFVLLCKKWKEQNAHSGDINYILMMGHAPPGGLESMRLGHSHFLEGRSV